MINTIGKIILYIILSPFLWIYFGFKMLRSKEQRNRNNILICIISFVVFVIALNSDTSATNNNDSVTKTVSNKTVMAESRNLETTILETTVLETTTVSETTTPETTVPETTTPKVTVPITTAPTTTAPETTATETIASTVAIAETTIENTTILETVAPEVTEQLVWITATGSKYHSINNCGNTNPNNAYQMSLSDAQAAGYEPCKRCYR